MENVDIFDEAFNEVLKEDKQEVKPTQAVAEQPAPKSVQNDGMVSFGSRVSSIPIPRFKASKDTKARIAILSKQVLPLKTHYVDGIGSFICLNDKCCEIEGLPRVRYLIPVVEYTTNKSGAVIAQDLELKALSLGAEQYDALIDAVNFSGRDVQDVDIIISCSDEQYQKLTFAADASSGAQWKSMAGAKDLVEKYKANKSKLYMAVARQITLDTYLLKKGFVQGSKPIQTVDMQTSIDDLLDD